MNLLESAENVAGVFRAQESNGGDPQLALMAESFIELMGLGNSENEQNIDVILQPEPHP